MALTQACRCELMFLSFWKSESETWSLWIASHTVKERKFIVDLDQAIFSLFLMTLFKCLPSFSLLELSHSFSALRYLADTVSWFPPHPLFPLSFRFAYWYYIHFFQFCLKVDDHYQPQKIRLTNIFFYTYQKPTN